MPNSEGFRAMFEWNTCLGSIPNSKGFLLRVRLVAKTLADSVARFPKRAEEQAP